MRQDATSKPQGVLNEFQCTRQIAEVLETYYKKLKETVNKMQFDHDSIKKMFEEITNKMQDIQTQSGQEMKTLNKQLNSSKEQIRQIVQSFAGKDQSDRNIRECRDHLQRAAQHEKVMTETINGLKCDLERVRKERDAMQNSLKKTEDKNKQLNEELNKKVQVFNRTCNILIKELQASIESNESLEEHTKTLEAQNKEMNEKICFYEQEKLLAKDHICTLEAAENKLKEREEEIHQKKDLETKISNMEKIITEKEKVIEEQRQKINAMTNHSATLKAQGIKGLLGMKERLKQEQANNNSLKEVMNTQRKELKDKLQRTLTELQKITESKIKLDSAISKLHTEIENERKLYTEEKRLYEDKINVLETNLKGKDEKNKLPIYQIAEVRAEKEQMQKHTGEARANPQEDQNAATHTATSTIRSTRAANQRRAGARAGEPSRPPTSSGSRSAPYPTPTQRKEVVRSPKFFKSKRIIKNLRR